jgi:hypothetical protein
MGVAELRASVSSKQNQVRGLSSENTANQAVVYELARIYENMKQAKDDLITQKNDMKSFAQEVYDFWKGEIFITEYRSYLLGQNQASYQLVVSQVDQNMAIVNNEKTRYENMILRNQGLIGELRAAINSLWTMIENWID